MGEKIYKTMNGAGALNIVLGVDLCGELSKKSVRMLLTYW